MEFSGLRWRYLIRNSVIDVDNAVGRGGWSQERLIVNAEPLHHGGGLFRFYRAFEEPWLTEQGETSLKVLMLPDLMTINCRLTINGQRVRCDEMFSARWQGSRNSWPAGGDWQRQVLNGRYPSNPHRR